MGNLASLRVAKTRFRRAAGRPSAWGAVFLLVLPLIAMAGCAAQGTNVTKSMMPVPNLRPIPTPTEFPAGSGQLARLRDSLALIRQRGSDHVAGAALVLTSDGFLVTFGSVVGGNIEVVLPNGQVTTPIRVANDPASGLTLIKISADHLIAAPLGIESAQPSEQVFASGFDQTTSGYGQIAGHIVDVEPQIEGGDAACITTDIDYAPGFNGGTLENSSGHLIGLVVSVKHDLDQSIMAGVPTRYVTNWISEWRATNQSVATNSVEWPLLIAGNELSLRYPNDWSVAEQTQDGSSFRADIAPHDPDVPVKISISIQPTDFNGRPLEFAHRQFDNASNAVIWGTVEYGQINGVRVLVNQEGARVDVVYLFADQLQIGVSLTAGYSVSDTGPQEQRATALYEAVLRSITFQNATSEK